MELNKDQMKWTEDLIPLYSERARTAANTFRDKYQFMHYSNQAFHQEMPKDIINSATKQNADSNANKYLLPWLTIVIKQLKKEHSSTTALLSECARLNSLLLRTVFDLGRTGAVYYNSSGATKRQVDTAFMNLQF